MQTYEKWLDPETLKLTSISAPGSKTKQQTLFSVLNKIFQSAIAIAIDRHQLKVWQKLDRGGNLCWYACDPVTGCSTCVETEDEMRVWIEQRYYK